SLDAAACGRSRATRQGSDDHGSSGQALLPAYIRRLVAESINGIAPDDSVGVGQILMKERCVGRQPWREELSQRRIEFDQLFFNRRAHHEVRVSLSLKDLHDLTRRFVVLAQARSTAVGKFHGVSA